MNDSDCLYSGADPFPAVTAGVADALRLGCAAIGFTIYPGSAQRNTMYEELRELALQAKAAGLVVVVWSYPRGSGLGKGGETAVDVAAYAAQIAAQLGAHIIKVKPPGEFIELEAARKAFEKAGVPVATLADRVRHVVQGAFDGRRIVIFSGGETATTEAVLAGEPRDRRGRRLRHDHGAQLVPAPARRGREAAAGRDGHLRGRGQVAERARPCRPVRGRHGRGTRCTCRPTHALVQICTKV